MAIETKIVAKIVADVDTRSVASAIKSIEKDFAKLTKTGVKIAVNLDKAQAEKQVEELGNTLKQQKNKISFDFDENQLRNKLNSGLADVKLFARDTGKELDKVKYVQLNIDVAKAEANLQKLKRELKGASGQTRAELLLDTNKAQSALTEAKRQLQNLKNTGDETISRLQKKFDGIGTIIKTSFMDLLKPTAIIAGITAIGRSIGQFISKSFELAENLQMITVSFEVLLGSGEKAKKLLKDLGDFAKSTPFELTGVRETTKQLLAYGIAQEDIIQTLTMLGNASVGNQQNFERLAYAYGQVKAAGKLMGGEMKQINETGFPLMEELARVTGRQVEDLAGNIGSANISFETFDQAIKNLTLNEGGDFFGLLEAQSKTIPGRISNVKDEIAQLQEQIGGGLLPLKLAFYQTIQFVVNGVKGLFSSLGTASANATNAFVGKLFDFARVAESVINKVGMMFAKLSKIITGKSIEFQKISFGLDSKEFLAKGGTKGVTTAFNAGIAGAKELSKAVAGIPPISEDSILGGSGAGGINGKADAIENLQETLKELGYTDENVAGIMSFNASRSAEEINIITDNYKAQAEEQKKREDQAEETKKKQGEVLDYFEEKAKDAYKAVADGIEESKKKVADFNEEIAKTTKELTELESSAGEQVAGRAVAIQDQLKETNLTAEERVALEKELALAIGNSTVEQRKRAELLANETTTERILRETEEKRTQLQIQLEELQTQKANEETILQNALLKQAEMEKAYTAFFSQEIKIRGKELDTLIAKLQKANQLGGIGISAGTIQSAIQTPAPGQVTNNVNVNANLSNGVDVNNLVSTIVTRIGDGIRGLQ